MTVLDEVKVLIDDVDSVLAGAVGFTSSDFSPIDWSVYTGNEDPNAIALEILEAEGYPIHELPLDAHGELIV